MAVTLLRGRDGDVYKGTNVAAEMRDVQNTSYPRRHRDTVKSWVSCPRPRLGHTFALSPGPFVSAKLPVP